MMIRPLKHGKRSAAALVEFALTVPLLLTLMLGIWELGRMVEVQQLISNAAREGGRQASSGKLTNAQVLAAVQNYLQLAGLSTQAVNNATITVTNLTSGLDAASANQMDHFQITVSVAYDDVRWVNLNLIANSSTRINASADWYCTRDIPITVNTGIPLQ